MIHYTKIQTLKILERLNLLHNISKFCTLGKLILFDVEETCSSDYTASFSVGIKIGQKQKHKWDRIPFRDIEVVLR